MRAGMGRQRSFLHSLPAPVKGWNALAAIQEMKIEYALQMDNWIPRGDYIEMRAGCNEHARGAGATDVESLLVWNGKTASKLLACCAGSIFDVTSGGTVGTALASSKTGNRWQYVNFNGQVIAVNGADTPIQYNGTAVSDSSMTGTGLITTNLVQVNIYKERLFFIEQGTMNAWYLPVKNITGTLAVFDLQFVFRRGGALIAMVTHSRDGGAGMDDFAAFITTEGEVAVYQGTDPSDATAWALVGVYKIGRPIGRRCFINYAAEVLIITENGIIPLSEVLPVNEANDVLSISRTIENAFSRAVEATGSIFGWEAVLYPAQNLLLFNIPQTNGRTQQFVMDTNSNAWCRFLNFPARCWAEINGAVYYGGSGGKVYRALAGTADNGNAIVADVRQAFSYFGNKNNKSFLQVRPILEAKGIPEPFIRVDVDFRQPSIATTPANGLYNGTPWGSPWGSPWGNGRQISDSYFGVDGFGRAASVVMRIANNNMPVRWIGTDVLYEKGNFA